MQRLRNITEAECRSLEQRGCSATSWSDILVSDDFAVEQLRNVRFGGGVEIGRGAIIADSYVANYVIGEQSVVEGVGRLECRSASSFGNGVSVATINESGSRTIKIYEGLTSQIAYAWAIYRDRAKFVEQMNSLVDGYAAERSSAMGRIGTRSKIIGAKFIREVAFGDDVVVEGASIIENATLLSGSYVGVDVQMRSCIAVEDSRIDTAAIVERCFIGESVIVARGFSAIDSLMFASSHLEGGEAASIFAGPCTVSHHKSTLLIAGLFSFFNAGSGANQSNHLFKCGAIHESLHGRGVKFASGAYVMAPAREGAFTVIKGNNAKHHDTEALPFSYLIGDNDGRKSTLIPAANIASYGTQRDVEKWPARDKRVVKRDVVSYALWNPYTVSMVVRGLNELHTIVEEGDKKISDEKKSDKKKSDKKKETYIWNGIEIAARHLKRGIELYNKGVAASLGEMLQCCENSSESDISTVVDEKGCSKEAMLGEWIDVGGAVLPKIFVEDILQSIEREYFKNGAKSDSLNDIAERFKIFESAELNAAGYHLWAKSLLGQLLGHEASAEDIEGCVAKAKGSAAYLKALAESDKKRDLEATQKIKI